MIEIEMDVFSGLPNPVWKLEKSAENEMISRVLDGGMEILPANHAVGYLGYRGFRIRATGNAAKRLESKGLETSFYVTSAGESGDASAIDTERSLIEQSVWLQDEVGEHALQRLAEIAMERSKEDAQSSNNEQGEEQTTDKEQSDVSDSDNNKGDNGRGACIIGTTSNNNFAFWNGVDHVKRNNCYNFGCNWRTNTFAQPGRGGTGQPFHNYNASTITASKCKQGCFNDGLLASNPCDGVGHYKLAVVAWVGVDYHFYRQVASDAGGARWAHKAGQTPAKNTDNSGKIIRNPSTADRGNYTSWGGYVYRHRNINPNIN